MDFGHPLSGRVWMQAFSDSASHRCSPSEKAGSVSVPSSDDALSGEGRHESCCPPLRWARRTTDNKVLFHLESCSKKTDNKTFTWSQQVSPFITAPVANEWSAL